jgi:HK97 gp10 family phage protein
MSSFFTSVPTRDGIEIKTNLPALKQQLAKFNLEFEQKVMRQATASAIGVFRRRVKALAPVLKERRKKRMAGTLQRAIYIKRSRDRSSGREHYFLGVRGGRKTKKNEPAAFHFLAFYWRWLEAGWYPRGRGRKLRGGDRSRALQRERNAARGAQKRKFPFIKPGFESGKGAALKAFYRRAETAIRKFSAEKTPR